MDKNTDSHREPITDRFFRESARLGIAAAQKLPKGNKTRAAVAKIARKLRWGMRSSTSN
jgi:hypothetical protein